MYLRDPTVHLKDPTVHLKDATVHLKDPTSLCTSRIPLCTSRITLCTSRIMILFVMNNGRLCSKLSKILKSKIQFLPNDIDLSSYSVIAEEQSNFILPFSPPHVQSNDWQDESFTETSSSSKMANNC